MGITAKHGISARTGVTSQILYQYPILVTLSTVDPQSQNQGHTNNFDILIFYWQLLRLSQFSLQETSMSNIITLISVDTHRFDQVLSYLWNSILKATASDKGQKIGIFKKWICFKLIPLEHTTMLVKRNATLNNEFFVTPLKEGAQIWTQSNILKAILTTSSRELTRN